MTGYQMFEEMINEKINNNENGFNFYAIQIAGVKENPYPKDSEEHQLYSSLYGNYLAYKSGRVGDRKARINIINSMNKIIKINSENPFNQDEIVKTQVVEKKSEPIIEKPVVEEKVIEQPTEKFEKNEDIEVIQDIRYVMLAMVKAYNEGNEINFKQFAIHLADIAEENPFKEGTEEFNVFAEMVMSYRKKPANIRRVHVLAERLCEIINFTEIYPEHMQPKKVVNDQPQKVLGVIPEDEKEKKNWFKFLHPWRKDEDEDDN